MSAFHSERSSAGSSQPPSHPQIYHGRDQCAMKKMGVGGRMTSPSADGGVLLIPQLHRAVSALTYQPANTGRSLGTPSRRYVRRSRTKKPPALQQDDLSSPRKLRKL